jgi:hypothetical protein
MTKPNGVIHLIYCHVLYLEVITVYHIPCTTFTQPEFYMDWIISTVYYL